MADDEEEDASSEGRRDGERRPDAESPSSSSSSPPSSATPPPPPVPSPGASIPSPLRDSIVSEGGGGGDPGRECPDRRRRRRRRRARRRRRRPNVILILADDLGYSDVGCFGASDIRTPHIDSLAAADDDDDDEDDDSSSSSRRGGGGGGGVRFSQMYNCARCCPSRASLLTGLYPHQAGVGHMVHDSGAGEEYRGYLRDDRCATIAEVLRATGGYRTLMAGKWHVGGEYPPHSPEYWRERAGDETHPTPTQRGFDEYYGTLGGGGSYYDPPTLMRNGDVIEEPTPDDYYHTDAINDEACRMIREASASSSRRRRRRTDADGGDSNGDGPREENVNGDDKDENENEDDDDDDDNDDKPFFLYVAHTAPHWPLHAPPDVVAKYRGEYSEGWDALRLGRYDRLRQLGLIDESWECSPRDDRSIPWEDCPHKDWEDARMACYAAQIDIMDRGIGRILDVLRDAGEFDDTLIMFLSDNGGCAELLREDGEEGSWTENYGALPCSDGTITEVGNTPGVMPGGKETFMSYDLPWANASNAPFRLFKSWVHEGGIATPFVAHWPNGINISRDDERSDDGGVDFRGGARQAGGGRIHHSPWIVMDIVATIYDVCGVEYPSRLGDRELAPLEGESFASVFGVPGGGPGDDDDDDDNGRAIDGDDGQDAASSHRKRKRRAPIFWEHQGNRAVREGKWKLVHRHGDEWELFDMEKDRTELRDLAKSEPERVARMAEMWRAWAERCGVKEWPLHPIEEGERDWPHFPWLW